jgi:dTDP-4-amino-4,6-dideoxygalactose transaminase
MQSNVSLVPSQVISGPKSIVPQRYDFSSEDIAWVLERIREVLETRAFLTLGRHGEQFERQFAEWAGVPYAVAVNSGTAALEIIFRALRLDGHEAIIPTNTFAATAFAALHAGGKVVFADSGEDLSVDPKDVERRITPRTKVVVAVHVGGLLSPGARALKELCDRKGLYLVEDAAHAQGSRLDGQAAGSLGVAGAFSFFSTKVTTTGEGGMIVTSDRAIADKARLLRDQAKVEGANYHEDVGYNWRMTELQAILGLAQLRRLGEFIGRRAHIARIYDAGWAQERNVHPIAIPSGSRPNYYKYVLFLKDKAPGEVSKQLRERYGVRLGGYVYDIPCHEQPVFRNAVQERLPRAEDLCRRHICPPIYPSLTDEEANYVVNAVQEVVR